MKEIRIISQGEHEKFVTMPDSAKGHDTILQNISGKGGHGFYILTLRLSAI